MWRIRDRLERNRERNTAERRTGHRSVPFRELFIQDTQMQGREVKPGNKLKQQAESHRLVTQPEPATQVFRFMGMYVFKMRHSPSTIFALVL